MYIRASAHSCEITPQGSHLLAGYPGVRRTATGILDPLLVSAVHLRSGSGGILLISLDVYALDPSVSLAIRRRVAEATGLKERNIFVGATRNHSGPVCYRPISLFNDVSCAGADMSFVDDMVEQCVKAASEASVASRPVSLAFLQLGPETGAVLVRADTGRVIAVVMVYDAVPNILGPKNTCISADFLAGLRKRIAARFGGSPVVVYFPSASAERFFSEPLQPTCASHIEFGELLAEQLVAGAKALKNSDFVKVADFSGTIAELSGLPKQMPPEMIQAAALMSQCAERKKEIFARSDATEEEKRMARLEHWHALVSFNIASAYQSGALNEVGRLLEPWRMQVAKIGHLAILGMPCLVREDAARALAAASTGPVFLTEFVDGDMAGSILRLENEETGMFDLDGTFYEPEAGGMVASTAFKMLKEIMSA